MIYCPRCRKLVNTNIQVSNIVDHILTTSYCEDCGTTIDSVSKKIDVLGILEKRRNVHGQKKGQS